MEMPLFSRYIFCKFDIQDRLPILVVPGVLSIVRIGKVPATIPESQISSLQRVIDSGMQCGPWPFVQAGQSICVARGPLAGLKGTVLEVKSRLRLILSLPLLQRSVAVEIDRDCVDFDHVPAARLLKIAQKLPYQAANASPARGASAMAQPQERTQPASELRSAA